MARDETKKGVRRTPKDFLEWITDNYGPETTKWYKTYTGKGRAEASKQRIDLSLLFTWRQIAKMKNSAASNLLILDETFDSSLDIDGIDNLTRILDTLEDGSNVFIISHKGDVLENKFRSKIEFFKERNFSKIK